MLLNTLRKTFFLFIPLALIALTFTNCDSSGALSLIGPEVEIDLDGNFMYKAVDPNFANACVEIRLPINIKSADLQEELINYLSANISSLAQQVVNVNNLKVSNGKCATANVDTMPSHCSGKRINEIPVGHDFKFLTYNNQVNLSFFGVNIVDNICTSL